MEKIVLDIPDEILIFKKDLYCINDLIHENTENHLKIQDVKTLRYISVFSVVS